MAPKSLDVTVYHMQAVIVDNIRIRSRGQTFDLEGPFSLAKAEGVWVLVDRRGVVLKVTSSGVEITVPEKRR